MIPVDRVTIEGLQTLFELRVNARVHQFLALVDQAGTDDVFPSPEEVRAAIPDDGITARGLARVFKHRVDRDRIRHFLALVKLAGKRDNATMRIVPRD